MLEVDPTWSPTGPGCCSSPTRASPASEFETGPGRAGRRAAAALPQARAARPGEPLLKTVRQLIESVNDTLKGQLDLEQHGGRTFEGVAVRVAQRILAMAAAIWHNHHTGQPVTRSLIAYARGLDSVCPCGSTGDHLVVVRDGEEV